MPKFMYDKYWRDTEDPHAKDRVRVDSLPGCCSASVVYGLYRLTADKLAKAEAEARHYRQHCVLCTVSTQQIKAGVGEVLQQAGWTEIHKFFSKWYGGGHVHVFAKNLVNEIQQAPPKRESQEDFWDVVTAISRTLEAE